MPAIRKFNPEDKWDGKVIAKPYIYYVSGSTYGIHGAVMLQPDSPIDKRFYGFEEGNRQTEMQKFNQTGAVNCTLIELTGSVNDDRYRGILTALDWHFTRNNEYAPITGSGLYNGFWHTSSLTGDLSTTDLLLIDISNVYYGEEIQDGSFFMNLDKDYDPDNVDKYYEWQNDDGLLLYINSGSLFTGSAAYINWQPEGRLIYDVSSSLANIGRCKVGYILPEGIAVISGKDSVSTGINDALVTDEDNLIMSLYGKHTIPVKTYLCHASAGKCNASTNPSFYRSGSDGNMYLSGSNQSTMITKVGLYDQKGDLVAVAGLSQPIEKKVDDDILIRIRIDT